MLADERRVGEVAAELVLNRLLARPRARLLLEPGRAPRTMFAALRNRAASGALHTREATVLQIEELAGGRAEREALLRELRGISFGRMELLDGLATDLAAEALRHAAVIDTAPVDLAIVGLDEDGGVALDAPPANHASGVRLVDLDDRTRALTVGLGTLYRARELLVLATGAAVAPALRAMLEGAPDAATPAALLRDHPRITIVCDRAAAARLTPRALFTGDSALIVLGHREPGRSDEHRISFESRARLRHARRLAERAPFRAAILTGYTSTGGLSEAEQMKSAWDEHAAPALLEVAGRNTAENASRSLPIILALGDVRRVLVVSSAWHLRVPWFFAPYRRFGVEVGYRVSFAHGNWPRMVAEELRGVRSMREQRRVAMRATRLPRD